LALAETDSAWKTAPEFHRLQQLEFDEATGTLLVRKDLSESRLAQILAYQRGRIDLTDRTLEEALEEFSRYQPITRFEYSDRSIGKLIVNTNLDFTDLDGLLTALQQEFKVYHTKAGTGTDTVVTLSRHPFRTPENHPRK
jgi:ferric-dicitrate binding protein FerR (iron transport regulator)